MVTAKTSSYLPSEGFPGPLPGWYDGLETGESGSGPYSVNMH